MGLHKLITQKKVDTESDQVGTARGGGGGEAPGGGRHCRVPNWLAAFLMSDNWGFAYNIAHTVLKDMLM